MASGEASETKSLITGILTSNPLRCTVQQLCRDFKNIVGYNIPLRRLGFSNVEEYLHSIPDTVQVIGTGNSAEVRGVLSKKSAHINVLVAKQKKDSIPAHARKNIKPAQVVPQNSHHGNTLQKNNAKHPHVFDDEYKSIVPKRVQNNLRKLIMRFPNGIWCSKLRGEYKKMFKEDLRYETYRFRSLIEMCSDLSEIFHYFQQNGEDFMLFDRSKPIPSLNQNEIPLKNKKDEIAELDWSLGSNLIPCGIVNFLDVIPQFSLDGILKKDQLDMNVGEIYEVDNFWMYPKYGELNEMLEELQVCFTNQRNRYAVHELFLQEGLYCTIYYAKEYHRGVIIDSLPKVPGHVKVLFIDYGSVGVVNNSEVWYLPEGFDNVPCQAIKAKLSNICSLGDGTDTCEKFRQMIKNAEIVTEVVGIDKKEKVLEVYLADITDANHIFFINDALVEKGYAKYKN